MYENYIINAYYHRGYTDLEYGDLRSTIEVTNTLSDDVNHLYDFVKHYEPVLSELDKEKEIRSRVPAAQEAYEHYKMLINISKENN